MIRLLLAIIALVSLISCASKYPRQYEVIDASAEDVPDWVEDYDEWKSDLSKKELEERHYSFYQSEPKSNRTIACKIAEVRAREKIATEISALIKNSFLSAIEGDPNDGQEELAEYVSDELIQVVKTQFSGSRLERSYWEQHFYQKELGADEDWKGHVCYALISIPNEQLNEAFKRAAKVMNKKVKGTANQEKMQKALEDAEKEVLSI